MNTTDLDRLARATAYDSTGAKIGSVGQVYVDDTTGEPSWVSVTTGLFGTTQNLVPLADSHWQGDDLVVAHEKGVVKDAPRVEADQHISDEEQDELARYYNGRGGFDSARYGAGGYVTQGDELGYAADDRDAGVRDERIDDGTTVTRSEERLNVGTETVETGRVRLRKYTTTEEQTVTVPVTKEKVVVERTPLSGEGAGTIEAGAAEEVDEVTVREERPVVSKDTVAVEEVSLGKEAVTEQETVSGQVRKEHIDVDGDDIVEGDFNR